MDWIYLSCIEFGMDGLDYVLGKNLLEVINKSNKESGFLGLGQLFEGNIFVLLITVP